jgi:hypothetical protein
MPPTYTLNLGLHKPATGEEAGIWGQTVNTQFDFLDTGIDGNVTVPLSASSYDLITNQGTDSVGRNKVVVFTGNLGVDGSVAIKPNTAEKIYFVTNKTTGGFALNFNQGSGPVFKLLNGRSAIIYADGLGNPAGVFGALSDLQVNSLLVQTSLIIGTGGNIQWSGPATFNQASTFQGLATFQAGATIAAPVTLNLGSDTPYDLYYRSGAGPLARLPLGSSGQVLTASGAGPSWAAGFQAFINMTVAGAAGSQIFYANNASQMVQSANLQFVPGTGLGLGMAPNRALSLGGVFPAVVQLDGAHNAGRGLLFTTNNVARWTFETPTEGEGGGNSGSNIVLRSAPDAGSPTKINFASYRTGVTTVGDVYNNGYGAQFSVVNTSASTYVQTWHKADGTRVASLDNNGVLVSTVTGGSGLQLDANKRLAINGVVAGFPLSTLHIGPDALGTGSGPNPAIVLEGTSAFGSAVTGNAVRMYFRSSPLKFVIQFNVAGTPYYAYLTLAADSSDGPYVWHITNNPQ